MLSPASSVSPTNDVHTLRALAGIADRWGYGYDVLSVDGRTLAAGRDLALTQGVIRTVESPNGIRICASDLVSIHDCERVGLLARSLTIIVLLDGDPLDYTLGTRRRVVLTPGNGVVITAAKEARLRQTSLRGSYSRSVVAQACPSAVADVELAEQIDAVLRTNAALPILASCRVHALANDLFASRYTGTIGRLLAESCALELLAVGLGAAGKLDSPETCTMRPQDVTKMLRVRDKIMSELDRHHRLSDLAQFSGVSVTTLKCKFQAVIGQSVFAFLRDQRLNRARHGMEREGWTVGQAAYYVGYRHATNFATAFRRRFGISPTAAPRH